jgi:LacI family transcriptional regulator
MPSSQPDIRKVAARAGVSVGTVSNVLNRPDAVAEPTLQTVLAAIDELRCVRNGSASRLRSARSNIVGLVVLDAGNPFFTEVARGAEEELAGQGYAVVVCNSAGSADRQDRHLHFLDEQRVAGVLITPTGRPNAKSLLQRMRGRGMSIALVDESDADQSSCSVAVGGPTSVRQSEDRLLGLRRATETISGTTVDVVRIDKLDGRSAYAVVDEVLIHSPDAVFCANEVAALGILPGCSNEGDRSPTTSPSSVSTTSIRRPCGGPPHDCAPAGGADGSDGSDAAPRRATERRTRSSARELQSRTRCPAIDVSNLTPSTAGLGACSRPHASATQWFTRSLIDTSHRQLYRFKYQSLIGLRLKDVLVASGVHEGGNQGEDSIFQGPCLGARSVCGTCRRCLRE